MLSWFVWCVRFHHVRQWVPVSHRDKDVFISVVWDLLRKGFA